MRTISRSESERDLTIRWLDGVYKIAFTARSANYICTVYTHVQIPIQLATSFGERKKNSNCDLDFDWDGESEPNRFKQSIRSAKID